MVPPNPCSRSDAQKKRRSRGCRRFPGLSQSDAAMTAPPSKLLSIGTMPTGLRVFTASATIATLSAVT